ncbi:VacJ family lipoprotein [Sphingobium yanoikuyae]|uniref:VacJ family lipoprotein n=1 Tax=Sphingobium yanoikuyae TaxID=13690 RepID=A0A6P1GBJ6_SPHYA|nr:VacJ family lipoprotein [Sphingobium yanoikuyae]QHD65718.1 VacJ family lipoprotein [Sphingobium yanoikuyae]
MLLSVAATGMMLMAGQGEVVDSGAPLVPAAAVAPALAETPQTVPADPVQPAQMPAQAPSPDSPYPPPVVLPTLSPIAEQPKEEVPVDPNAIVVTGDTGLRKRDPFAAINEQSFEAVQAVDKALIEPVAKAYNKGLPRPVRKGLRNFFSNLGEPVVFAAYMLQFKPGKAFETAGRFAINTTLGFVGLFDVAKRKPFNLPYRPNGLANTLGFYGVGPGPYMYLPLVGPTTLRDIIGDTVDKMILPFAVGKPFTQPTVVIPMAVLDQLGERAAFDERIQAIRSDDNPYGSYRDLYLNQRKAEIEALHGRYTPGVTPVYGPGLRVPGKDKPAADAPEAAAPVAAEPAPAPAAAPAPEPVPAPAPKPLMVQPLPADPR